MIAIRPATAADAAAMAALRWEFRAGREAPAESEESFVARCSEWMRGELHASGPWRAWVAERDARLVGQVWLMILAKLPNPVGERERHAYVSNLYVLPSERGGAGTQLLEAALAHADTLDVDRVVLWPSPRSVTLYERYGFRRGSGVMERSRTPPSAAPPRK